MKRKQQSPTYEEKGVRYMMCSCGNYISVGETAVSVTCPTCVNRKIMINFPELHEDKPKRKSTGRPAGWHFMVEFVDVNGNVFHKGVEQPKLKGTLKPTKIVPKKKTKRRTKDEILIARQKEKKAALKKAHQKQKDFLNHKFGD